MVACDGDEFRARRVKEFVALAPVNVRRDNSVAGRYRRRQRPQHFSVARVNGTHAIAVSGRGNLERAVTREIDERVLDGSRLPRVALIRGVGKVRAAQTMP